MDKRTVEEGVVEPGHDVEHRPADDDPDDAQPDPPLVGVTAVALQQGDVRRLAAGVFDRRPPRGPVLVDGDGCVSTNDTRQHRTGMIRRFEPYPDERVEP